MIVLKLLEAKWFLTVEVDIFQVLEDPALRCRATEL